MVQYKLSLTFEVCAFLFLFLLFILGLVCFLFFVLFLFSFSSLFVVIMIAVFPFPSFDVLGVVNMGKAMGISWVLKFLCFPLFFLFFSAPLGDCM